MIVLITLGDIVGASRRSSGSVVGCDIRKGWGRHLVAGGETLTPNRLIVDGPLNGSWVAWSCSQTHTAVLLLLLYHLNIKTSKRCLQ